MKNKTRLVCAALAVCAAGIGQEKKAPASPPAETSVTIQGKAITIKYSAPSVRGRKIFGELEPYGKVWRAGANAATSLTTDANLTIGGTKVPPGNYTLYVLLDPDRWQLIINKQTGQWGTVYNQDQDLARIPMQMSKPSAPIETMKITLASAGGNKGTLTLAWENSVASVPFTVE